MQRKIGAAIEGSMSQGSSFHFPGRQLCRFPLCPSGLPLVKCPRCGNAIVECKSWKQGGRVFFKCESNEQFVIPNSCTFFKWLDSYQRMVEGMELDVNEEAELPVARAIDAEGVLIDEGKMEKLSKWMKLLVLINIAQVVLIVIVVFILPMK
uniref:GRF-type domain-containing protein n=1 Tax=Oryza punctata TaxID=4537 RepID=A0A0E0MDA6_ORYPU